MDLLKKENWRVLEYNVSVQSFTQSVEVARVSGCNGYTATVTGDTAARVNGQLLFPSATPATVLGDSISVIGNHGETFTGRIEIEFIQPLGANPQIELLQKFYTNYPYIK